MEASKKMTPGEIVREFIERYERLDMEGAKALLADDLIRYGEPGWGRPQNKELYTYMWDDFANAVTDFKWEIVNIIECGNTVAAEIIESGYWTKPYNLEKTVRLYGLDPAQLPAKELPPTGQFYIDYDTGWYTVNEEGKIDSIRAYLTQNISKAWNIGNKINAILTGQPIVDGPNLVDGVDYDSNFAQVIKRKTKSSF